MGQFGISVPCGVIVLYEVRLLIFRAHERWGLPEPPDYVTFAKRMLVGGYYFKGDETYEVSQAFH